MRWAGPAEEMESTCGEKALEGAGEKQALEGAGEERAPVGAGEERAPEGAGEEQAPEGAGEERVLEGAGEEQALEGARLARNWTEPAGKKVSWTGFRLGIGDLPDVGSPSLPNSGGKCLGAPQVDGRRSRAGTGSWGPHPPGSWWGREGWKPWRTPTAPDLRKPAKYIALAPPSVRLRSSILRGWSSVTVLVKGDRQVDANQKVIY